MSPSITPSKDYFMLSPYLEEAVYCKYNLVDLPEGEYTIDDIEPEQGTESHTLWERSRQIFDKWRIDSFTIVYKYGGQVDFDYQGWFFGDTVSEVADQLLDAFYRFTYEYQDEEEREDKAWLESLLDK